MLEFQEFQWNSSGILEFAIFIADNLGIFSTKFSLAKISVPAL